jgi:CheY-like chemotaxis protein
MHKHVLLVDDDPAALQLARHVLECAGHTVAVAPNGLQAKWALGTATFDVVVTDIFMPEMDGLELMKHICETYQQTAVIAVSAGSSRIPLSFLPIAAALGADLVLDKPVPPRVLVEAIERIAIDRSKGIRSQKWEATGEAESKLLAAESAAT